MEAIAPDLLAPGPALIGGCERATGRIVFPLPADRERYEAVELPREGRIWSWTVQRFRPKSPPYAGPDDFEPFAIAYVELPGACIVEARLSGFDFNSLRVGLPCRLVVEDFGGRASFAFAPLEDRP
ncbi:MAG: Zn-ribbon domain-containing OB-fold protein [Sphingomonadaceae bacterium]